MIKVSRVFPVIVITGTLLLAACSGAAPPSADENESSIAAEEHVEEESIIGDEYDEEEEEDHAHIDPPAEYADLTNPFTDDQDSFEAGEAIYSINCASCHGPEGAGDGPAAEALDPKPASLADAQMITNLSDGYLFWRVSEGGAFEPFNSVMPTWKGILSEDERWQVISYIRTLGEEF